MKLIIEIDDIKYQNIVNAYSDNNKIYAAIKNGTPIHEGSRKMKTNISRLIEKYSRKLDTVEQDMADEKPKANSYLVGLRAGLAQIVSDLEELLEEEGE